MNCEYQQYCGGCCFRDKTEEEYRRFKEDKVKRILAAALKQNDYVWEPPIFLPDGLRRRASMAFINDKNKLQLGFNENGNMRIVDCLKCPMLTPRLNALLPALRNFLEKLCAVKDMPKNKKKHHLTPCCIQNGDILLLEADNGIDIVLESLAELKVGHRMEIADFVNANDAVIRFSCRKNAFSPIEPIVTKLKPIVKIGKYEIEVAPGTFLQASKQGEEVLIGKVKEYVGNTVGKVADLFCGIGTFSYPLAENSQNKIVAADVNKALLKGFKNSVYHNMIHNVEIVEKNLFKYPFTADELAEFEVVVLDPPRSGALAQVKELAAAEGFKKPQKVIMVSCNPHSFVNDANVLIEGGYKMDKAVMVDQFVYSKHTEMAAMFTKK